MLPKHLKKVYPCFEREMSQKDISLISKWIVTGGFTKCFKSDGNSVQKTRVDILNELEPLLLEKLMLFYLNKTLTKKTIIISLSHYTVKNHNRKHTIKVLFNKIINDMEDMYYFIAYSDMTHGIREPMKIAIRDWFKHKTVKELDECFKKCSYAYGWTYKKIIEKIDIKPRDKKEKMLFCA